MPPPFYNYQSIVLDATNYLMNPQTGKINPDALNVYWTAVLSRQNLHQARPAGINKIGKKFCKAGTKQKALTLEETYEAFVKGAQNYVDNLPKKDHNSKFAYNFMFKKYEADKRLMFCYTGHGEPLRWVDIHSKNNIGECYLVFCTIFNSPNTFSGWEQIDF